MKRSLGLLVPANVTLEVTLRRTTTPDYPGKTVKTFQFNFQFRAMLPSCPKGTNSPPSPPLVQCCFALTAQVCISCVTANNNPKGGRSSLNLRVSIFVRASAKNKYFCNVSQQVLLRLQHPIQGWRKGRGGGG